MKGRSCGLFLCLFLGIACFSGYQVLRILHEYRVGADAYFKLEQFASLPPASEETEETPAELAWPEVDFTALAAVNPDVTAWLYGPDTGISYPVVQGTDNDYYLDHLLDGTANSAGCLFVDTSCRPDFSGHNTVIYGHRMKNGTMFAALGNYQEQVYYDAHPVFLLVTPEGRYVVELFSGYVADTAESAWMLDFSDEQAYLAWLEEVGEKSAFSSKVSPRAEDRVVTLSTCSVHSQIHSCRWKASPPAGLPAAQGRFQRQSGRPPGCTTAKTPPVRKTRAARHRFPVRPHSLRTPELYNHRAEYTAPARGAARNIRAVNNR